MTAMPSEDFEAAYETLAVAIDSAPVPKREALFLTRLALLLAHELGDIATFKRRGADRARGASLSRTPWRAFRRGRYLRCSSVLDRSIHVIMTIYHAGRRCIFSQAAAYDEP